MGSHDTADTLREYSAGEQIAGRYELQRIIDTGGFARVWAANDQDTGRRVAVKVGSTTDYAAETIRARFSQALKVHREITRAGGHENIVRFIEGDVSASEAYVVTERLDGGSLRAALDGSRRPGSGALSEIGVPLADAVCFLHRQDVLHLDIKPENVLFRDTETPVLIDFNTAVYQEGHDDTLFYRDEFKAPEQLPGKGSNLHASTASDVYALGLVLRYLLTGETLGEREITSTRIAIPSGSVSKPITGTLRRATEGHPNDRYQDGCALGQALTGQSPADVARVVAPDTGETFTFEHGDAFGRQSNGTESPALTIRDEDRHISPLHAVFEQHGNGWQLRDRSLNGTYVRTDSGWIQLLSQEGVDRRDGSAESLSLSDQCHVYSLSEGDLIAPVDPEYGIVFRFIGDQ